MLFFKRDKPKIKVQTSKRDGYSGWLKCTTCSELIHGDELEKNKCCCPKCDYHYRMSVDDRLNLIADSESFTELFGNLLPVDPLNFSDTERYSDRIVGAQKKSGRSEAIVVGRATINGIPSALGVMDFSFMGGSMGSVVGERLTSLIEYAEKERIPLVVVSSSGGARMQESTLSLMQMAKTAAALGLLRQSKIPFISILTNPTTGGVTASFASLGDVIIAEPKALICFAGPRVIEQTIGHKLPEGAQMSEFLLQHGMIDCIVNRHEMKTKLSQLLNYLSTDEKNPHTRHRNI